MRRAERIYRLLIKLYPAKFREEYAGPLERQFADDYREVRAGGGRALFWIHAAGDLLVSVPTEIARELGRDLAFALRIYRKRLPATALAVAALAFGIGATTGVFSVLNAVLLRSLPFAAPERLVELANGPINAIIGRAQFDQWQASNGYLAGATTFSSADMNLALGPESARIKIAETSAAFFDVLGVHPALGRLFAAQEDAKGGDAVAVIGYGLWQQMFGGSPGALGRKLILNGTPATVIGVAPPGFDYPGKTAAWLPTVFDYERFPKSGVIFWRTVGRLKEGITLDRARAMFLVDVERRQPQLMSRKASGGFVRMAPALVGIRDQLAGPVREASLALLGVTVFVLLIACANVAHLLLSRFAERRQELAIRMALGASRARLAQQAIAESLLLTGLACAGGIGIARWAAELAATVQPAALAAQDYAALDWRVLLFALSLAGATGIVFGALPALALGSVHSPAGPMRAQGSGGGKGANHIRRALIATQAALALALLAGSSIMGRAFLRLLNVDLGYRTDHVVTLNVSLSGTRYAAESGEAVYFRNSLERLRAIPGVRSAAAAQFVPLVDNMYMGMPFSLGSAQVFSALRTSISPDYFRTMGARLLDGREFTAADRAGAEPAVIVNKSFADALGTGARIVGLKIAGWRGRLYTIAGVVADERLAGPSWIPYPQAYFPLDQSAPDFATFVARVNGNPEAYLAMCRDALREIDSRIPVYDVKTLDKRLADNLVRPRFYTTAIVFFAGFALLLAVTGAYGLASYGVAQRTHEIGVRMAVGAGARRLRLMLLWQGMLPLAIGSAIGVAGALMLSDSLRVFITDTPALNGRICGEAALALTVSAASAIWMATGNIARMDPIRSLRGD